MRPATCDLKNPLAALAPRTHDTRSFTGAALLFGSRIAGLALGLLSTVVAARLLDSAEFGRFTFLRSVTLYLGIFFDFGASIATGRLLALSQESSETENLCGAWLVLFTPIAVAYVLLLAASSFWMDEFFHLEVSRTILLSAIPALGIPLERSLRELFQGQGTAVLLGILNAVPWALFLLISVSLWIAGWASFATVVFVYFGAFFATMVVLIVLLRPRFDRLGECVRKILAETRAFGLEAYIGRIIGTGTYQLDSPMIAYFTQDPAAVGFYGLAKALVAPIALGPGSLSVAIYRDLARAARLPARFTRVNLLWLLVLSALYLALARPVVFSLFSSEYAGVLPLLYVWILSAFVQGAYQLPNFFLSAKGEGRVLRVMATWFAVANVLLNFSLIPPFGAFGASVASTIANGLWLYICIRFYQKTVRGGLDGGAHVSPW